MLYLFRVNTFTDFRKNPIIDLTYFLIGYTDITDKQWKQSGLDRRKWAKMSSLADAMIYMEKNKFK